MQTHQQNAQSSTATCRSPKRRKHTLSDDPHPLHHAPHSRSEAQNTNSMMCTHTRPPGLPSFTTSVSTHTQWPHHTTLQHQNQHCQNGPTAPCQPLLLLTKQSWARSGRVAGGRQELCCSTSQSTKTRRRGPAVAPRGNSSHPPTQQARNCTPANQKAPINLPHDSTQNAFRQGQSAAARAAQRRPPASAVTAGAAPAVHAPSPNLYTMQHRQEWQSKAVCKTPGTACRRAKKASDALARNAHICNAA
jgi:hypothetical protein